MRKITQEELDEIFRKHKLWLCNEENGERADLRYCDLQNKRLAYKDLRGAYLTEACLREADLTRAYLRGADLTGAYLRGADLTGADLRGADLTRAYLTRAYLRGADLTGADLTGAYLRETITLYTKGLKVYSGQVGTSRENNAISYYPTLNIWTTGCFQGTLQELKEKIEETHEENEFLKNRYYRVIDFILNEYEEDERLNNERN